MSEQENPYETINNNNHNNNHNNNNKRKVWNVTLMEIHSKIDVNNEKWHNLKMEGGSKYWITNYWTTILYVG